MIFDCGSVMADVTFSRWEGWEEPKKFGELLVGGMERTKKSRGIAAQLTSLLLEELYCRDQSASTPIRLTGYYYYYYYYISFGVCAALWL